MKGYDELQGIQLDAIREIASIGAGNAATALSSILGKGIKITVPKADLVAINEIPELLGGPENVVSAILVRMSGDLNGVVLYMQDMDFINIVLESILGRTISDYSELDEMCSSALIESGNIMISSFTTALSNLAGLNINLSVPAHTINMAGAILMVPMVMIDFTGDKLMFLDGNFVCDGQETPSRFLLLPDVESLNILLEKLGVRNE